MKIVFTAKGMDWDSPMDPRFGRTDFILLFDEEKGELTHYDNRAIENEAHGAGPKTAQLLFDLKADVLITGNGPGGNAETVLRTGGIKIYAGAGQYTVKEALSAYHKNELEEF
jgi:predicted Fe-Mo cluster-binding NifX family protein